jgi:hypothetical protein
MSTVWGKFSLGEMGKRKMVAHTGFEVKCPNSGFSFEIVFLYLTPKTILKLKL